VILRLREHVVYHTQVSDIERVVILDWLSLLYAEALDDDRLVVDFLSGLVFCDILGALDRKEVVVLLPWLDHASAYILAR
jgi:hypothetical protein